MLPLCYYLLVPEDSYLSIEWLVPFGYLFPTSKVLMQLPKIAKSPRIYSFFFILYLF